MSLIKAWFICPYKRRVNTRFPSRYCAMDDFTQQIIYKDGGKWSEIEVLGNHAIVKVLAEEDTISTISSTDGFNRIPKDNLNDSLSDLKTNQKDFLKNKIQSLGYSLQELQDKFGNDLGSYTLKDVLKFIAKRRLKPRYDSELDEIICDGEEQVTGSVDDLDKRI